MPRVTIASDNFNRASLGANWTNQNTALGGDVSIDSSIRATGQYATQPTDQLPTMRWAGAGTFTSDQFSAVKLVNLAGLLGSTIRAAATVRSTGSGATRSYYEAVVRSDGTSNLTTELAKWVSGTRTILHSASVAWANNDVLELEAEGTTLRVLKSGTALGGSFTQTDASLTTGTPGAAVTQAAFIDDWVGGNITSADTTAPTLSSPTGTGGTLAATGTVSTNEAGGTLYYLVSANPTETVPAQGSPMTGWASQPVTAAGVQAVSVTGLTAGTRYLHYVHDDGATTPNRSARASSASFVVAAGGGATITSSPLVRNTGAAATDTWALWGPGEAFTAWVHHRTTGALLVKRSGLLTNSAGVLTFTDAAVPVAAAYRVDYEHEATGELGVEVRPAT